MTIGQPPAPTLPDRIRSEPFRLFFPVGVLLGWIGVGHWLLYGLGLAETYSCFRHGLLQTQAFLMAFALGFLWTALPRRTAAPVASPREIALALAALLLTGGALLSDAFVTAELGYLALFAMLLAFAARRFLSGAARRRPPAAFVLLPLAAVLGVSGALLILARLVLEEPPWTIALGALFIEQGVFLCLVMGIGALVMPLMGGTPPPPDLGSSPHETRVALGFLVLGLTVAASLVAETAGFVRSAPIVRGTAVAIALGWGGGAFRLPGKPGFHRKLVWVAAWLAPAGLVACGLLPDYRVPALHVLFIGGFSLMAFGVATHVSLSHLDLNEAALGRPRPVVVLAVAIALALLARLAADSSQTYFEHLASAALCWMVGSAVWLAWLAPRLLRR
ncbi:MAG: NnrS family protein [Candidatus Binatia bacterium]